MSQTRKISRNNTRIEMNADGSRIVRLHGTAVVQYWPDDRRVRLCTGGWNTATTRTRMNQALNEWNIPASVSMQGGFPSCWVFDSVNGSFESAFSRDGICYFTF